MQGPIVAVTAPTAGATFYNPASLTLAATATPGASAVSRVEFYVDGTLLGQSTNAPYTYDKATPSYGTHAITAKAVDTAGLTALRCRRADHVEHPECGRLPWRILQHHRPHEPRLRARRQHDQFQLERAPAPIPASPPPIIPCAGREKIKPRYSETYTFSAATDDGVRLWVNGQQLINQWVDQGTTTTTGTIVLTANQSYDIVMEYYQGGGGAVAQLMWSSASRGPGNASPRAVSPCRRRSMPRPPCG